MRSNQTSICLCALILTLFVVQCLSQTNDTTSASTSVPAGSSEKPTTKKSIATSTTTQSTTTLTPKEQCQALNGSCDQCVKNAKCLYCFTDKSCTLYPTGDVLPSADLCALDKARWGVCWVNFEALIIAMSVIGGIIILTITICCCYCCCCRGKNTKKYDKEDRRHESQQMQRKMKQDERRSERKSRLDEIRRKYGLMKDDAPYERFDDAHA